MKKINRAQHGKTAKTSNQDKAGERGLTRSVDVLERLSVALKEETAAINNFDDEKLKEHGDIIQALFDELTDSMPSAKDLSIDESKNLYGLLKDVKQHREKNRQLLEKLVKNAGEKINKLSVGRQTLQAYKGLKPDKEELFVKKKC